MKTSQWHRAVENRCVFTARLKAVSDRSGDHSAGGRRFHVAGPLTAKLRCPVAVRVQSICFAVIRADTYVWQMSFVWSALSNRPSFAAWPRS